MTLFKCGLAAGIVYWLTKSGQLDFNKIGHCNRNWLPMLTVLLVPMMLGPLFRWHLLARAQGLDIDLKKSIHVGLVGYFVSIFVPSGLGLDGSRALYAMRKCPGQAVKVISTLVMDRLIGLFCMVFLGAAFGGLLWLQSKDPILGILVLGLWAAMLGFVGITLVILSPGFASMFAPLTKWMIFDRVHSALVSYREHKIKLLEGFILTVPGHVGLLAATYFGFVAFDIQIPCLNVFAIAPIVSLSNIIPLTPMGIGVSEWVASVLYSRYHFTGGADVNMVLRLVNMSLMAVCGVAMLFPLFDKEEATGASPVGNGEASEPVFTGESGAVEVGKVAEVSNSPALDCEKKESEPSSDLAIPALLEQLSDAALQVASEISETRSLVAQKTIEETT